tara:strand:- start:134 stop:406 length:273 start_codon:yes stop_codon:yes gene_type:complete
MSAEEKSAVEHVVLKGLKSYIEEVIEYSEQIDAIKDEIYVNSRTEDDNHRYAMEHINDECNGVRLDLETDIDSLQNEIADLKQMIEELQK